MELSLSVPLAPLPTFASPLSELRSVLFYLHETPHFFKSSRLLHHHHILISNISLVREYVTRIDFKWRSELRPMKTHHFLPSSINTEIESEWDLQ